MPELYITLMVAAYNKMDLALTIAVSLSCKIAFFMTLLTIFAGWNFGGFIVLGFHPLQSLSRRQQSVILVSRCAAVMGIAVYLQFFYLQLCSRQVYFQKDEEAEYDDDQRPVVSAVGMLALGRSTEAIFLCIFLMFQTGGVSSFHLLDHPKAYLPCPKPMCFRASWTLSSTLTGSLAAVSLGGHRRGGSWPTEFWKPSAGQSEAQFATPRKTRAVSRVWVPLASLLAATFSRAV